MRIYFIVLFLLGMYPGTESLAQDPDVIRLASTTSAKSSGLLDILVPAFEKHSGYRLVITMAASGRALRMARLGEVDMVLVHAPDAERDFIAKGWGMERRPFMKNNFILVGPKNDPAQIKGLTSAVDALKRVAGGESTFYSRGDDSGTHKKELHCWSRTGVEPEGNWYVETGLPMGATLRLASEKQVYTLVDKGSWLAFRDQSPLVLLVEGDPELLNIYSTIIVNPERNPDANFKAAAVFSDWLLSVQAQQLVQQIKIDGEQLFYPISGISSE